MNTRHRLHARKRYLSLGLGELTAAAVFALVAVVGITPRLASSTAVLALWCALAPLLLVLVQAGAYWLLARGWVGAGPMPSHLARLYRGFRIADPLLLLAGLVGVLVWWPDELWAALLVMVVWTFGVIEYLNYFVVRLSYPASEWFAKVRERRRPRLMKDVGLAGRSTERRAVAHR
ncbi:hypothetical protein ACFVAJ_03460 [Agromyces sp. NPDC057679]|uniref:hypothetical protein n=1 Tax=Agromyces sp. NPDC057679 TaxID=3346207 RepID=UPI0036726B13